MGVLTILLLLICFTFLVVYVLKANAGSRPSRGSVQDERNRVAAPKALTPKEALDSAVEYMMGVQRGPSESFALIQRSEKSVTFSNRQRVAALQHRAVYSTLTAFPLDEGCRIIISGESHEGHHHLRQWALTLPLASSQPY